MTTRPEGVWRAGLTVPCPVPSSRLRRVSVRNGLLMLPLSFGGNFVFKDHAEDLAAEPLGQPRVLDDGQLEAFTVQHGVVIGMDGTTHAFDDHQVRAALTHHRGQDFIQSTGRTQSRSDILFSLHKHTTNISTL